MPGRCATRISSRAILCWPGTIAFSVTPTVGAVTLMLTAPVQGRFVRCFANAETCSSAAGIGWLECAKPRGSMFAWAPVPPRFAGLGSVGFSKLLLARAKLAVSPQLGFGEHGEGYVRIALVRTRPGCTKRSAASGRSCSRGLTRRNPRQQARRREPDSGGSPVRPQEDAAPDGASNLACSVDPCSVRS
jgi:hypothetical protein